MHDVDDGEDFGMMEDYDNGTCPAGYEDDHAEIYGFKDDEMDAGIDIFDVDFGDEDEQGYYSDEDD